MCGDGLREQLSPHSRRHSSVMPSVDREESRDRELVLKHQSSFSESGRASVPMYVNFSIAAKQ